MNKSQQAAVAAMGRKAEPIFAEFAREQMKRFTDCGGSLEDVRTAIMLVCLKTATTLVSEEIQSRLGRPCPELDALSIMASLTVTIASCKEFTVEKNSHLHN